MKLFEITFNNGIMKRAWGADILEALNVLGFYNPAATVAAHAFKWREVAEVVL